MKMLFHSFIVPRAIILLALLLGSDLVRASDPKPDETFNFGQGVVGSEVSHDFHLINAGSGPIAINEIKTSCPCTRIVAFSKVIAPGQSGIISIETKLDRAGNKDVQITAVINGTALPRVFTIKGEILASNPVDPDLFAEPMQLNPAAKANVLYIDVRPNIAFDQARIPASINVPAYDLTARTYLKSRSLIIVGTGIDDIALVPVVETCRKEGFTSIWIMRGGIRQWQQSSGKLDGIFGRQPFLDKMTASELLSSANRAPWLVLAPKSAKIDANFASTIRTRIISYDDVKTVDEVAEAALAKNIDVVGVAVFLNSDQDSVTLSRKVPSLLRPLFEVSDSWNAFAGLASATAQSSEEKPAAKTLVSGSLNHRILGCPTCP